MNNIISPKMFSARLKQLVDVNIRRLENQINLYLYFVVLFRKSLMSSREISSTITREATVGIIGQNDIIHFSVKS